MTVSGGKILGIKTNLNTIRQEYFLKLLNLANYTLIVLENVTVLQECTLKYIRVRECIFSNGPGK